MIYAAKTEYVTGLAVSISLALRGATSQVVGCNDAEFPRDDPTCSLSSTLFLGLSPAERLALQRPRAWEP